MQGITDTPSVNTRRHSSPWTNNFNIIADIFPLRLADRVNILVRIADIFPLRLADRVNIIVCTADIFPLTLADRVNILLGKYFLYFNQRWMYLYLLYLCAFLTIYLSTIIYLKHAFENFKLNLPTEIPLLTSFSTRIEILTRGPSLF